MLNRAQIEIAAEQTDYWLNTIWLNLPVLPDDDLVFRDASECEFDAEKYTLV